MQNITTLTEFNWAISGNCDDTKESDIAFLLNRMFNWKTSGIKVDQ